MTTDEQIALLRESIAELDRDIASRIQVRSDISRRVQQLRMGDGGAKVNLSQETVVRRRWVELLKNSKLGNEMASVLLELGRGEGMPSSRAVAPPR